MHVSTSNLSMTRALFFVAVALVCCSTGQAYAQGAPITIVNNLDQSLVFKEVTNRQDIQIYNDPPAEVRPHSSSYFLVADGSSMENRHLNIKYTIKGTDDQLGIVYKEKYLGEPHCPKEHPDWVTETVEHCGGWRNGWTYTFTPK